MIRWPVPVSLAEQVASLRRTRALLAEENAPLVRKACLLKVRRFVKGKPAFTIAETITKTRERPSDVKAALRKMLCLGEVSRTRKGNNAAFIYRAEA